MQDARAYLQQARDLHATIVAMQMRIREQELSMDLLKSASMDGMPHGSSNGKALENAIVEQQYLMDEYVGQLMRWTALSSQARRMFDRARDVLLDGRPHAIGMLHLDVTEMHYLDRMSFRAIAYELKQRGIYYSESTLKWHRDQAIEWLSYSRGADGMPLVPIVSE